MSNIISCLSLHLKRCIVWRVVEVEPSDNEAVKLDAAGVDSEVLRSYIAWRRSCIFTSLPIILAGAISGWVDVGRYMGAQTEGDYINVLGEIVLNLPSFAQSVLLLTAIGTLILWSKWRISSKVLKVGWLISFVMPLIPAAFPTESLLTQDSKTYYSYHPDELIYVKIIMAVQYAITILPVLITFPSGVSRGALRIRGLLPDSSLTSWILTFSAPSHSLLIFAALVVIVQLAGTALLIIGALLLTCAPWLYVFRRGLYVGASTETSEKKVDLNQKIMMWINLIAIILLLIWAVTGRDGIKPLGHGDEMYLMHYSRFVSLVFESIGRILITTIVFTDALLRMTVTNWRNERKRRQDEDDVVRIDGLFALLESNISRESKSDAKKTSPTSEGSNSDSRASTDEELGGFTAEIGEEDGELPPGVSHARVLPVAVPAINYDTSPPSYAVDEKM